MSESKTIAIEQPQAKEKKPMMPFQKGHGIYPQSFEDLFRAARVYHASGIVKDAKSVEQVLIKLDYGASLGLSCSQAAIHLALINDRPVIWGDMALAIIRSSGLLERFHEKIEQDPKEGIVATCTIKRRDYPDERVATFSEADARTAGLWNSTVAWKRYPRRMLQMRARMYALRDEFADLLMGLTVADPMDTTILQEEPAASAKAEPATKTEALVEAIKSAEEDGEPPALPSAEAEEAQVAEEPQEPEIGPEPVAFPPTPNATNEAKGDDLFEPESPQEPAPEEMGGSEGIAPPDEWTRTAIIKRTAAVLDLTTEEATSVLNTWCKEDYGVALLRTTSEQRKEVWQRVVKAKRDNEYVNDLPF